MLLGGTDPPMLTAEAVRERIGWLGQATHLFDDTIRNNLLLARPEADEAALWAALDAARIGDLVRALPDGLETWVGEGGDTVFWRPGAPAGVSAGAAVAGPGADPG